MKTKIKGRRLFRYRSLINLFSAAALALSLASCGGGDNPDEGGIIGTGIQLRGTVPTNRQFADASIGIKAASGERFSAVIASDGRFSFDETDSQGPYLLRVDLGNGNAYYGVAHSLDASAVTQNVHAYSDLAIRNWFATQAADIDAAFASTTALTSLPTVEQITAINTRILELMRESLAVYDLAGTDLSTVSFNADDTGVDQFLDRNPVLINNGNITIIISAPDTNIQSIVASGLPVNTDLTADDISPPTAPTGLRVLPSATDEIVLAWESASDNIGVVSYDVLRDGVLIATSPFPTFIDSPLSAGVTYTYAIVAVDAAGNRSPLSIAGSSAPLASPDITAPPTPTALTLVPGIDNIQVSWAQSDIADVASFRVLRGEGQTILARLGRVTSTSFTDGGLNSGVEYCYQVQSSDASENESAPSEIVCETTTGTAVTTAPPVVTPPGGPVSAEGLAAVDVSGLACTTELQSNTISTVVTLDQDCYRVTGDVQIRQGGQLIIAAGTVLKFATGVELEVVNGGSLTANGAAAQPVVFSALDRTAGNWNGLIFREANSTRNQLNSTVVEFAGLPTGSALMTQGFVSTPVRLSLNNVLIRNGAGDGIDFSANTFMDEVTGLVVTQNARSGRTVAMVAANFGADTKLSGNSADGLVIDNNDITAPTVWQGIDVPYLMDDLDVAAPFSIPPGAELRFNANGALDVSSAGSLSAIGTAQAPILFTGQEPTPGYWTGISIGESNSTNNRLEHVVVEYGGTAATSTAGIFVQGFLSAPVRLAIKDTTLRFSQGAGFRFSENVILSEFANVTSTANGLSGVMAMSAVGSIGEGNDLQGNTQDGVEIFSSTLNVAATARALNVPYIFDRITVDAPLTLSPGVSMQAVSGGEIRIRAEGSLNAIGTADQPISFFGASAIPGFWIGLSFSETNSVLNVLQFVNISDGGGGSPATSGNIGMSCFIAAPARLSVSDSNISNSAGWGIFQNTGSCIVDFASSNTFSNNAQGTINTP